MDAFFQKYHQKLEEKCALGLNGECFIWTGSCTPNGKYGVINCRFPGAIGWKLLYVHRLAYMIQHRAAQLAAVDVSHLCHNTKCINVAHLVLEPHGFNNSRQTCVSKGECIGHIAPFPPCLVHLKMPDNNLGILMDLKENGQGKVFIYSLNFILFVSI